MMGGLDGVTAQLIDGWPWGWGALAVDTAPKGWRCPCCGQKVRKDAGRHFYPFTVACTDCARAACQAVTEKAT
jgi:hypothetical protein